MVAAEDVERQIAVAAIVAVKEAALPGLPCSGSSVASRSSTISSGGGLCASRNSSTNSRSIKRRVVADLVVARRLPGRRVLEPVEGRLAGQRRRSRRDGRRACPWSRPAPGRGAGRRGRPDPRSPAPARTRAGPPGWPGRARPGRATAGSAKQAAKRRTRPIARSVAPEQCPVIRGQSACRTGPSASRPRVTDKNRSAVPAGISDPASHAGARRTFAHYPSPRNNPRNGAVAALNLFDPRQCAIPPLLRNWPTRARERSTHRPQPRPTQAQHPGDGVGRR